MKCINMRNKIIRVNIFNVHACIKFCAHFKWAVLKLITVVLIYIKVTDFYLNMINRFRKLVKSLFS